jgi:hypothetical protein
MEVDQFAHDRYRNGGRRIRPASQGSQGRHQKQAEKDRLRRVCIDTGLGGFNPIALELVRSPRLAWRPSLTIL